MLGVFLDHLMICSQKLINWKVWMRQVLMEKADLEMRSFAIIFESGKVSTTSRKLCINEEEIQVRILEFLISCIGHIS